MNKISALDKVVSSTQLGSGGSLTNILSNKYTKGYEFLPEKIKSPSLKMAYAEIRYMYIDAFAIIIERYYKDGEITREEFLESWNNYNK